MLYPLKFNDVYKNYIWGGRTLSELGKKLPEAEIVAESWEISAHPNGPSLVINGKLTGFSLNELLTSYPEELLGVFNTKPYSFKFPLLVKLIDACDNLSVQVHPNDEQAAKLEHGELGKNEMWYIVAAKPGSRLIIGTKPGTTRTVFSQAVNDGKISEYLQEIEVIAGDVIDIPAGLVHAIGKGIVICEIQQNSDTTYRVYDYDRKDAAGNFRPLHIDKALEVIDFSLGDSMIKKPANIYLSTDNYSSSTIELLVLNEFFKVEKWNVSGRLKKHDNIRRFCTLTILEGSGLLRWNAGSEAEELKLVQGESLLIPASVINWELIGDLNILHATLPHPDDTN